MKKKECVICGGLVVQEKETHEYKCVECGANHASDVYVRKDSDKKGFRVRFSKLKLLLALLAALYLFYLALRVFIY